MKDPKLFQRQICLAAGFLTYYIIPLQLLERPPCSRIAVSWLGRNWRKGCGLCGSFFNIASLPGIMIFLVAFGNSLLCFGQNLRPKRKAPKPVSEATPRNGQKLEHHPPHLVTTISFCIFHPPSPPDIPNFPLILYHQSSFSIFLTFKSVHRCYQPTCLGKVRTSPWQPVAITC